MDPSLCFSPNVFLVEQGKRTFHAEMQFNDLGWPRTDRRPAEWRPNETVVVLLALRAFAEALKELSLVKA
jgi:hypothetical protein